MASDHDLNRQDGDIIYARKSTWMPVVMRQDDTLYLKIIGGANALHDPRTFMIPINSHHLQAIKTNFIRHMLLWVALLPLCYAAGNHDPIDEVAAIALCDNILLGSERDIKELFQEIKWDKSQLIAHNADPALLGKGELFAAMKTLTEDSDWKHVEEYYKTHQRDRY